MLKQSDRALPSSAGLLRRCAAGLYDAIVIVGLLFPITAFLLIFRSGEAFPAGDPLYLSLIALSILVFYVGFWSLGGQTPGMRAWKIRLETKDGAPLRLRQCLTHFVLALILNLSFGLGWWWALFDPEQRSLQERLAGTTLRRFP